ncbi:MAG: hypothetical protein MK538_14215 [Planctomycetes bacterium]|nr:hypothetical protein [Planctomycetota bacterium]
MLQPIVFSATSYFPRISARLTLCVIASVLSTLCSGCGTFRLNQYAGPGFVIYSDRNAQFVATIGKKVDLISDAYTELFQVSRHDMGFMTIVLEGEESNVVDYGYSPDVLGYYVPVVHYLSVDTNPIWPEGEGLLEQILFHEVAHHYIVSLYPKASDTCWLNEGLAGVLEVSLHRDRHFEYPLFHPVLFSVSQQIAYSNQEFPDLEKLVGMTWTQFHGAQTKEKHYALSWSIVYFILEHHFSRDVPLAQRVEWLCKMTDDEIVALEQPWLRFLRGFDSTNHLLELGASTAPDQRLSSTWALNKLGTIRTLDDLRILKGLSRFFSHDSPQRRFAAYSSFVERLERASYSFVLDEDWVQEGLRDIRNALRNPANSNRLRDDLIDTLSRSLVYDADWVPTLIQLLRWPDGLTRAKAAACLARIASKPTVINPSFWRSGRVELRVEEAEDWDRWWTHQSYRSATIP